MHKDGGAWHSGGATEQAAKISGRKSPRSHSFASLKWAARRRTVEAQRQRGASLKGFRSRHRPAGWTRVGAAMRPPRLLTEVCWLFGCGMCLGLGLFAKRLADGGCTWLQPPASSCPKGWPGLALGCGGRRHCGIGQVSLLPAGSAAPSGAAWGCGSAAVGPQAPAQVLQAAHLQVSRLLEGGRAAGR